MKNNGITVLIYKKQDPAFANGPANFRPITLEPVTAKGFTSLIRNRIYSFISKNNYIESHIQKGFWQGISGTVEHTELLSYLIDNTRNKQHSVVITLLDLRYAFGEVHHKLIKSVLRFHNIPSHIHELIDNVYQDFRISIATKSFVTKPVIVQKGVFQGDSLSPLLFNMCVNTLFTTLKQKSVKGLGYHFADALGPRHWFQFADDSAVTTANEESNKLF